MADRRRREEELRHRAQQEALRTQAERERHRGNAREAREREERTERPPRDRYETARQQPRYPEDMDMDSRMEEPRAAARPEYYSRGPQGVDVDMDDDPRYGTQPVRDPYVTSPGAGPAGRPTYREPERDEYPPRQIYEHDPPRSTVSKYNDFFLPGDGINREVIQMEITKYLGQDATVRAYQMQDGRRGYLITAYRALTSAMISSIKDTSSSFENEQRRRQRQGRETVPYEEYAADTGRQAQDRYPQGGYTRPMDIDEDSRYRNQPPGQSYPQETRDTRNPPLRPGDIPVQVVRDRHGRDVVTTTANYPPESYPALYPLGTAPQSGPFDDRNVPRTILQGGTTPPPGARPTAQGVYNGGYPPNTQAIRQPATTAYDARAQTQTVGYPDYSTTTRERHRPGR